jgi:hypothetical protein
MRVCGKNFSSVILDRIREEIKCQPSITRRALSLRVCDWLDWRSPCGKFQEMSARKALVELDRRGVAELPKQDKNFAFQRPTAANIKCNVAEVSCELEALGDVTVQPISSRYCKESKIWKALLDKHHYLGRGQLCGAQLRYIVKSSRYGYLGALSFSSASWALKDRDKHIGWTEAARISNLQYVVCNDRFLIVPTVKVKNLASHILSLALCHLPKAWQDRYNYSPVLVETFVDPSHFTGSCYKGAGWICVGKTSGRRSGISKMIFLRPLSEDWREKLCCEPELSLGQVQRPESPSNWAEEEFGTVRLYDNRLKQRLYTIAQDFYNKPQANIPEASSSRAKTIGAYRFFSNKKLNMDVILTAHTEATIERIKKHDVVLAPQDTTTLNYTTHPMTEGLGPINNASDKSIGLILHDTIAFTENGTPLGVLDAQCWARDPASKGKPNQRKKLPIEQKESIKWLRSYQKLSEIQQLCPETMLVSIGDRESDIYELFMEAGKDQNGPKLLVRLGKNRGRKVGQESLWEFMSGQKVSGVLDIHIPRRGSRKARDTKVDIRFSEVELTPPQDKTSSWPTIRAWAVYVLEQQLDAAVVSPVEWLLLTTVETRNFQDAQKRVEWYSGRWGIEVYHRTLKSGCRIKDRQLGTADRLETCLGVDMVVAWRVYHLTMLGRQTPKVPCTAFFKDVEWKALCCYVSKDPHPPEEPPELLAAIHMIGGIGGHLGRKADGPPGTQTVWRGLQRLDTISEMYAILTQQPTPNCHPLQSGP